MASIAGSAIAAALPFLLEKLFGNKSQSQSQQQGGNFLTGSGGKFEQLPTQTPGQNDLIQQLIQGLSGGGTGSGPFGQGLGSGLQNLQQILGGSPESLQAFQAPAMRQFNEQIVPGIAEIFSQTGAGSQKSSAFGQQLGQAGAGLAEKLSGQRSDLQSKSLEQLMGLLGQAQKPQFTTQQIPGQEGFLQNLLSSMLPTLASAGTSFLGGGLSNLTKGLGFMGGPKSTLVSQGITRTRMP